jgi:hypothetical protein
MKPILNTFVLIAPDSTATAGTVPPPKGEKPTVAVLQHQLLTAQPYALTLEDLIFEIHVRRMGLSPQEAKTKAKEIRKELFAKPHACMRASPLTKQYGWGVHHDGEGRMALYGVESAEYRRFASGEVPGVKVVMSMRRQRTG